MKVGNVVLTSISLLAILGCLNLPPRPASVKLFDNETRLVGFVDLLEIRNGVRFRVHTIGLDGGIRGFNIHVNPACDPPSFTSAGPLFAPPKRDDETVVAGDLPDITVGTEEWADTTFDWAAVRLDKSERGLFRDGGTSLVINETPDTGQASPNSGSRRIACGVLFELPEER
jgi:Cu-Zn family superoxide dismutase